MNNEIPDIQTIKEAQDINSKSSLKQNNKSESPNKNINLLRKINSKYILMQIFENIQTKSQLKMVKYNKELQNRLEINANNFKEFCRIEIEIELDSVGGSFINPWNIDRSYLHIYFNDKTEEQKAFFPYTYDKNIFKIKIIIDHRLNSLYKLFENCPHIISINFLKFNILLI